MRHAFGIQAQDRRAAMLAVRARTEGATVASLDRALASGEIVRTWAMRTTLHLIAAVDLPTVLAIYGPLHLERGLRRLDQLGIRPEDAERVPGAVAEILAEEAPLDRHEIAARLRERGIPVAPEGQAPIHAVARAAHAGALVEVGEGRYGPLDVALPDREDALAALARRYAASHAPATIEDYAKWSGLPAGDLRWDEAVPGEAEEGGITLLPAFDEWMLGWASRDAILPLEHAKRAVPGGGIIRPVAIADGRVFATWRLDRPKRRIELDAFGRVTKAMRAGLEEEVAAIGDFLGTCLALKA